MANNGNQTPDQAATEKIGRAIDGQIARLNEEKDVLLQAQTRIAEIDAELAILQTEKARIDARRPPKANGVDAPGKSG